MAQIHGVMGGKYTFGRILPEETWPLRAAVLWPEKVAGPLCALPDDEAQGVFHVGGLLDGEVCSIATFMPQCHPFLDEQISYRLRAMATHPDHRGKALGRGTIACALAELDAMGCGGVWADARHVALGFYACLGWEVTGPSYEVPLRGLHRLVWRRLGA